MLAVRRYDAISAELSRAGTASTEDLARQLGVSAETVRRDLLALERAGRLRRVHGGAVGSGGAFAGTEPGFLDRSALHLPAKRRIGHRAAQLLEGAGTVVLDVGTTALEVARAIPSGFTGTVATGSLLVAAELAGRGITVLVSGGRVRAGDLALSNAQAVSFFADLHPDVALIGSGGIDATAGLTDFHLDEVAVRRTVVFNAAVSYVLADATKFGRIAAHRVCALAELTGIVTDRWPATERADADPDHTDPDDNNPVRGDAEGGSVMQQALAAAGVELIVADPDGS